MKYILLMTGTKAGVDTYRAWTKKDIDTHMASLRSLVKDLRESGEFVADQGLTGPEEAKVVRGEKKGMPITDGIFPESKEFLLGYWIVDVATPGASLCYRRPAFDVAGTRRGADKHAHRSAAVREPSPQMVMTGRREPVICSDYLIKAQGRQKTKGGRREIYFDDECH